VPRSTMSPELLQLVAGRFKVLAEPARLEILNALRNGEMTVSELVDETGLGQANVSKHLQLLLAHGFLSRRKDGLYSYYALADRDVFKLCDLMCGRLASEAAARRKVVVAR
jgi:DNA-binding transcriptional ArsR family regulator